MNITIYQMILEPKNHDLIFQDLKSIFAACQNRVPAEIYEHVYHGEISAKTLEDIFYIFNVRHPEDYCGALFLFRMWLRCMGLKQAPLFISVTDLALKKLILTGIRQSSAVIRTM